MQNRIPLPDPSNSTNFDDVFDYLQKVRERQSTALLEKNRLAQNQTQFNKNYALQQAAESRNQQLFPLQLQAEKEKIAKEQMERLANQYFYNMFMGNGKNTGALPLPVNPSSSSGAPSSPMGGLPSAVSSAFQAPFAQQALGMPSTPEAPQTPQAEPISPQANMPAAPAMPKSFSDLQKQLDSGQEVIVKPPMPGREGWDQFAGQTRMGIKIPDIKTRVVEGVREDIYPSGKIVRQKEGLNTEEKEKIRYQTAVNQEEAKALIKDKTDADKYFRNFSEYADNNIAIQKIMDRSPTATGFFGAGKKYFKMGGKDIAAFNRLSVPMVGTLGKELSSKGGAVALQFAQGGKYDSSQPYEYNQGIAEANNDAIVRDYNRNAEEYRAKHGKEPPYKLPKFYRDWEKKREKEMANALAASGTGTNNAAEPVTATYERVNGKLKKVQG